jgi:hypothetical protein
MATLRAGATMTPLDVEAWTATAAAFRDQLRALSFVDDGVVHPATGAVHAGWRDLTGTHPAAGTRYAIVTVDQAGVRELVAAELVDDDRRRWRARLAGEHGRADVTVDAPDHPRRGDVECAVATTVGGYFGGPISAEATVDLADGGEGVPARPLVVRIEHRRVRGTVDVRLSPGERWDVAVTVRVRGRGLLRPMVALAGPLASSRVQRELHAQLARSVERIEAHNARLASTSPESMARDLLCRLVDETVVDLPS